MSLPRCSRLRRSLGLVGALTLAACGDGTSPDEPDNTFDLTVGAAYIVQSTQTRDGTVPLVAGRPGVLRVFTVANEANTAAPTVSVQIFWGSTLKETVVAGAPGTSVPTAVRQEDLTSSWNFDLSGALIQPGLRFQVTIDPQNSVGEANNDNNVWPAAGAPRDVSVSALAPMRIRFVPIQQTDNQLTATINESNKAQFLSIGRKILPAADLDADIHAPYSVSGLGFDPQGNTWQIVLAELDAVRIAEGSDRYYYGVVQTPYPGGGVVGIGMIGGRTALGWDRMPYADETLAHELGHNLGRRHAPCGGAGGVDPQYPYSVGLIGAYGLDVETREIKTPSEFTDIMGYCDARFWISDYNYQGMFGYRLANPATSVRAAQPTLLVWGHVTDGELTLEPSFELVTSPVLPTASGPYTLEGVDEGGARVFSISFAGDRISDLAGDRRNFAFAVPIDRASMNRLARVRLRGHGKQVERTTQAIGPQVQTAMAPRPRTSRGAAGRLSLQWNAAAHPAVMVRDARTGTVLSFARGGAASVAAPSSEIDLFFSDGVRSVPVRVRF